MEGGRVCGVRSEFEFQSVASDMWLLHHPPSQILARPRAGAL